MKITALVSDNIAKDVMSFTRTSSVDEAIAIALKDWLVMHKLKEVKNKIYQRPAPIIATSKGVDELLDLLD